MTATFRLACIDSEAPPLFSASPDGITRSGYEPDAASLIAQVLGFQLEWVMVPWADMIPTVLAGAADAVWCGQGITPERAALVAFSTPYAVFNETVLVRTGDAAAGPGDLAGYRVGAIEGSTNMALALTFPGIEPVVFGASDDVFGDMMEALRRGDIDAFVDDDVATIPLAADPDFQVAFTVPTRNRWGVAVAPGNTELLAQVNQALDLVIADGRLSEVWHKWMPDLAFPLVAPSAVASSGSVVFDS